MATAARELRPGVAWDVGCGTGRDAIYLASLGWKVIAIDRLEEALRRGQLSAQRLLGLEAERIEWHSADADSAEPPVSFDLALMLLFFCRPALQRAAQRLSPGGSALLEAFTPTNREKTGKPRDPALTIDEGELRGLLTGFVFSVCEEAQRGTRHTIRAWATKIR